MTRVALIATTLAFAPCVARAGERRDGDVDPVVSVADGRFVVAFCSGRDRKSFQLILSPDGETLVQRQQVPAPCAGPRPFAAARDDHRYVLEPDPGRSRPVGKLCLRVQHTGPDGEAGMFYLDCSGPRIDRLQDVALAGDELLVLASSAKEKRLRLLRFDLDGKLIATVDLGSPAFAGSSPAVSRLAQRGDVVLVAWGEAGLQLAWWDPASRRLGKAQVDPAAPAGSSISIAAIGDDVLIAHEARSQGKTVIRTLHLRGLPGGE